MRKFIRTTTALLRATIDALTFGNRSGGGFR